MAFGSGADQLDSIPKRIGNVAARNCRDARVSTHLHSRGLKSRCEREVIGTPQRRMRLACRTKLRLHAQMDLHAAALKPASTTFRQLGRFRDFRHTQQIPIKLPRTVLRARRHSKLHMINGGKRNKSHKSKHTIPKSKLAYLSTKSRVLRME